MECGESPILRQAIPETAFNPSILDTLAFMNDGDLTHKRAFPRSRVLNLHAL